MPASKSKKTAVKKKASKKAPALKAKAKAKPAAKSTAAMCCGCGPAEPSASKRMEVTYKGRVQGVGFRFNAEQAALGRAVTGWVRNEHNGDVTLVAEGRESSLLGVLDDIRKSPVGRHIQKEQIRWCPCRNEFDDFRIEYHC